MSVGIQVQSCERRRRNMEVAQDLSLAGCEEHIRRGDHNITVQRNKYVIQQVEEAYVWVLSKGLTLEGETREVK